MFNAEEISRLEQVIMEDTYGKHNNHTRILEDIKVGLDKPIAKAIGFIEEYFEGEYWPSKNERIAKIKHLEPIDIIHKILSLVIPHEHDISYQQVVSPLARYLAYDDIFDGVRTASELVAVVCFSDLYDVIPAAESESGSLMIHSNYSLSKETKLKLEKTKYLPPLIVPPEPITSNYCSGYLTKRDSVILGKGNHHDNPLSLDVLNSLNNIKLSLDVNSLEYEEEYVEPSEEAIKIKRLTKEDLAIRKSNHLRMAETSVEIYNEMLDKGNEFYLTWQYDKRGRVYSAGYAITVQGTDYKKSLLNLTKQELIEGI